MDLDPLYDIAFERGCGVSRSDALLETRRTALLAGAPHVPYVSPEEVAEALLLGESLAEAAFMNLPDDLRESADNWPIMSDDVRVEQLALLLPRLKSEVWRQLRGTDTKRFRDGSRLEEALPAARGSWRDGTVMPNCLGMAQMLIGFAAHTGARHYLVDTLNQYDRNVQRTMYDALTDLELIIRTAPAYPHQRMTLTRVARMRRLLLESFVKQDEGYQAHHALLIEVGHDWWLVDPYLERLYILPAIFTRRLSNRHDLLQRRPDLGFVAQMTSAVEPRRANDIVTIVTTLLGQLAHEPPRPSSQSFLDNLSLIFVPYCLMIRETKKGKLSEERVNQIFEQLCESAVLTTGEFNRLHGDGIDPGESASRRATRTMGTVREARRSLGRLIDHLIGEYVLLCDETFNDVTCWHPLVQMSHPAYHLAVMTLNHVAHHAGLPGAHLLRYSASQWVLHDTVKEVEHGDNRRLKHVLRLRIRRMKRFPPAMVLPELRRYVAER